MRKARKYSSEIVKEALIEAIDNGTYDATAKLMVEEYAKQQSMEFAQWIESDYMQPEVVGIWINVNNPKIPINKKFTTVELYAQFLLEQSQSTQK